MDENLVLGLFLLLPVLSGGLLVLFARHLRTRSSPPGWPRLLLGNLLALLTLLALGLAAGEIGCRFLCDTTDALGCTKLNERWFERHWQSNPSGYRDDLDYSLKIKPGKRRISFVGDSFTAGHGIKHAEDRFANRLRRAHPEWEIHLLAQPGFDTGNELDLMEKCLGQGYQIDQVVLVYCLNDVADLFPEWAEAVGRIRAEAERGGWFRQHSYLVNTLYYRITAPRNRDMQSYFEYVREGYQGRHWEQQQQRLKAFRDLVESHGGRFAVVTFPFFQALGPHYEYQFMHDELNQCWRALKVPHLDLLSVYQALPPGKLMVSRSDPHPNEAAHALAADALEPFLQQQLATTPNPRP
jgi:lysophospholipase L1-like esterase